MIFASSCCRGESDCEGFTRLGDSDCEGSTRLTFCRGDSDCEGFTRLAFLSL